MCSLIIFLVFSRQKKLSAVRIVFFTLIPFPLNVGNISKSKNESNMKGFNTRNPTVIFRL